MSKYKLLGFSLSVGLMLTLNGKDSPFGNLTNPIQQNNQTDDQVSVPALPDVNGKEESDFSVMLNRLLESKELSFSFIKAKIQNNQDDPINVNLTNLCIDKSGHAALNYNLVTDLSLDYKGLTKSGINLCVTEQGNALLSYQDYHYTVRLPKTLDGLFSALRAIGIDLPSLSGSTTEFPLSTISDIFSSLSYAKEIVSKDTFNGYCFTVQLPDIEIDDATKVAAPVIKLYSDSKMNFTGFETGDLKIQKGSDTLVLNLNGLGSLTKNTYQDPDMDQYQDLSSASDSIFTTLVEIGNNKKTDVSIKANITDTRVDGKMSSQVDALLQADCSSTFSNLAKGDYFLSLHHTDTSGNALNDLKVRYQDSNIYLNLNDSFKGRVANSDVQSIMDYVSDATNEKAYKGFSDLLNRVIKKTPLDEMKAGDLSRFDDLALAASYVPGVSFSVTFDAAFFGLDENPITISVNFTTNTKGVENGIKNITVSNLQYQGFVADFTLAFKDYTDILPLTEEEAKTYTNFKGSVPIFTTLADIAGDKRFSANYSLSFKDYSTGTANTSGSSYIAKGNLSADMTALEADESIDTSTVDGFTSYYGQGKYRMTLGLNAGTIEKDGTVTNHGLEHDVSLAYQNHAVYLDYNYDLSTESYVLKNALMDTQFGDIKDVIDSKTKNSASESLDESSSILDEIKNSENYQKLKNGLQSGSLKEFGNIISITNNDNEDLVIDANPDYFLGTTDYAGKLTKLSLTFNTQENTFTSISFYAKTSSDSILDFNVSFTDYQDNFLTDEERSSYTQINEASQLISVCYSIPTQFEKFGLNFDGKVVTTKDDGTTTEIAFKDSSAAVNFEDKDNPKAFGGLTITHPFIGDDTKTADQKIEFTYAGNFDQDSLKFTDHTFSVEYNDNMHVDLKKSTIDDITDKISKVDEDNLLYRYLGNVQNGTTGMPIMDFINTKDPSKLLAQKYVDSITFGDHSITMKVSPKLFDAEDTSEELEILTVTYDADGITGATLAGAYQGKQITASIHVVAFEDVAEPEFTEGGYTVDMSGFVTLLQCLIDTTMKNYFHLSGTVNVPLKVISLKIDELQAYCEGRIIVQDDTAYAYVLFLPGRTTKPSDFKTNGLKATELFVKEEMIELSQTEVVKKRKSFVPPSYYYQFSNTSYKVTKENFTKYIAYYLLTVMLDLDSISAGKIAASSIYAAVYPKNSDGQSSSFKNNDFSHLIKEANVNNGTFTLKAAYGDINNLLDISPASFNEDLEVRLTYDTSSDTYQPFTSIYLKTGLSVAGGTITIPATINISLSQADITLAEAMNNDAYMKRWKNFTDAFHALYGAYDDTSKLDYYTITGFSCSTFSYTVSGNNEAKKSITKTESEFSSLSANEQKLFYAH